VIDAAARHLEWRNFRELIDAGVPAVQPVTGHPDVAVFVDEAGSRIGLRTPAVVGQVVEPSPVAEIEVRTVNVAGLEVFEISTRASQLFAEFYAVVEEIADRMQLKGASPVAAFGETLVNWRALLRPAERMSDEQRLGLFGELLILDRILASKGPGAITAWTGPMAEPHDFRLGEREIEVKTTSSRRRSHQISSLEQLEPSPGRQLFLASLQIEPAGNAAGLSLTELVDRVRTRLEPGTVNRESLESSLLVGWRYSDVHGPLYQERYQLRTATALIQVTDDFPRLTPNLLAGMPGSDRIEDVQYRVTVDGLGVADGTDQFLAILPGVMAT
jgi:hypothetical protein